MLIFLITLHEILKFLFQILTTHLLQGAFFTARLHGDGFVCLDLICCLGSVIFSFTLAHTVSFSGLKFEVAYLVFSDIDSIRASKAVVI